MNEMPIMNQQNSHVNHLTLAISEQDIERAQERFNHIVACICELGLRTKDLESFSLHSTEEISQVLQSIHEQAHMPVLLQLNEKATKLWRLIEAHAITQQNPPTEGNGSKELKSIIEEGLDQLTTNLPQIEIRSELDSSFATTYLKSCELVSEEDGTALATYKNLNLDDLVPQINLPVWFEENMYAHIMPELEMKSKEVLQYKQNEFTTKKLKLLMECNVFDVNITRHD